ncbi:MAG: hypothetical protein OIF38_01255 [Cellvibrionaceae bacterium]|nr:hypothetical protein [Cellvibrionaceae bacterium]
MSNTPHPLINIYAGRTALAHLRSNGLSPEHISTVFGASGAAKWLAIYGLDRAIFETWLSPSQQPIQLFGTSVGAWKLAAAAQSEAGKALFRLADAYIAQTYSKQAVPADVVRETSKIIDRFLPPGAIEDILNSPNRHYNCGAVRCSGSLAHERKWSLLAGMSEGFVRSIGGSYGAMFERVVFSDARRMPALKTEPGIKNLQFSLSADNFVAALKSSGAIPYIMNGVDAIVGAEPGVYRDGGLLDYHPIPSRFWAESGLVLYPHFYDHLIPNWFDKFYSNRRANAAQLDNVIMISPSADFVRSLPDGRLPDRKDFSRYKGRNEERQWRWRAAMNSSTALGEAFLEVAGSGDIAKHARPFPEHS